MSHDPNKIEELLNRGVERVFPSPEFLKKALLGGRQLKIYLGVDPTGESLHLGHVIPLMKLAQLQALGHQIILLIGDQTAIIGDPTDKTATRKKLTRAEVLNNCRNYQKQASKILKFNGHNPAELRYNSKWLAKLSLPEVLELASNLTYAQTIKRDMFQQRINDNKDLYLHEFLYPLMQGYDTVAMDVDGEVGGNDQTFNMLVGRDLLKKIKNKEKFVIATKLLEDSTGKKMGKTEGNMVTLADEPNEMFGKIMSWPDNLISVGLELLTFLSLNEVRNLTAGLTKGVNPKDVKSRLAFEVVKIYHGAKSAKEAGLNFEATFKVGAIPENLPAFKTAPAPLSEILLQAKIVESKTEFRRLVAEGAIENLDTKLKVGDVNLKVEDSATFKVGKKRFLKIEVSK